MVPALWSSSKYGEYGVARNEMGTKHESFGAKLKLHRSLFKSALVYVLAWPAVTHAKALSPYPTLIFKSSFGVFRFAMDNGSPTGFERMGRLFQNPVAVMQTRPK